MQEAVHFCSVCGNVTDVEPCSICRSEQRDRTTICVVEDPLAVMTPRADARLQRPVPRAARRARPAPRRHCGRSEDRRAGRRRRKTDEVTEVILATNPNVEGDTTGRLPGAAPGAAGRPRHAPGAWAAGRRRPRIHRRGDAGARPRGPPGYAHVVEMLKRACGWAAIRGGYAFPYTLARIRTCEGWQFVLTVWTRRRNAPRSRHDADTPETGRRARALSSATTPRTWAWARCSNNTKSRSTRSCGVVSS